MKKISILLLAIATILASCSIVPDDSYQITGSGWEQYNGKEFQILVRDTSETGIKTIASSIIENGKISLQGNIDHPQTAFLGIYTKDNEFCGWKQDFIAEPGTFTFVLKEGEKKASIEGGKYNDILLKDIPAKKDIANANKNLTEFAEKYSSLKKEEQDEKAQRKYQELYSVYSKALQNGYVDLFKSHNDPYVRLLCISHLRGLKNVKEELANLEKEIGLVPEIANYYYSMKKAEEMAKNRKTVGVGSVVKDFTAKNLEGESFNLAKVLKQNKYVLVEFWASWCGPCRAEIPHMKDAYENFKDKDFEIVSFTLDHVQKSWKKASDKEQIPWINVGDLKAHSSPVVQMYGVQGIPANFLVNQEGEIVAVNLRGTQLDEKLEELLR
ncbi:TlpA disulfide reductase family protein [Marinifilum caeruleilacunae]|uniref:AhpC/TSA family protein n=1 Tax=Marinifilum caeruleilacunae TaxID=2499076 RepID=A0ABX1X1W7_9BACT|nr:TlpA disulfide reductase family protein [Marinifilum caeruleilacunae]NOU62074.1 AhpC/TSA family protein [Marinifilum caeruleilacunae]